MENRKLAAILFADIAGYTAFMQKDEHEAMIKLDRFKAELGHKIAENQGEIIQFWGDGCLAVFNNAVDSVDCARDLQMSFQKDPIVPVRIGLHLGDVILKDDNAFGDSVNVASRIESMGVPGAVLFSETIRNQIKNQPQFQSVLLGGYDFKNVEEPLNVYALSNEGIPVPKANQLGGKLKEKQTSVAKNSTRKVVLIGALILTIISAFFLNRLLPDSDNKDHTVKSLAILPFINTNMDPELNYLTEGIPEGLINRLSSIPDLKVFARNATFTFRDSLQDIKKIREMLQADAVFTGQIARQGDQLVLNCQLIDAKTQGQIWGSKIRQPADNILEVEDVLVSSVLDPLKIQLLHTDVNSVHKVDPEAYMHYLKGKYLSYGSTSAEADKALDHFREAIRIDPKYALAYAAIANEKIIQALFSTATRAEIFGEARTAIQSAKALDPKLPEAYLGEGAIKFYGDFDWKGAEESYKEALELDPLNTTALIRYSAALGAMGRHEKAVKLANKAATLDPISISSLHNLGWVNLMARNFEASQQAFGKALELHPNWTWGYVKKAYAHMFAGERDLAIELSEKAETLMGDWGSELLQIALIEISSYTKREDKKSQLVTKFFNHIDEHSYEDPYCVSSVYYNLGDYEKAFEWEERTVRERSPSTYLFNVEVFYSDEFFRDPRHQQILQDLKFID